MVDLPKAQDPVVSREAAYDVVVIGAGPAGASAAQAAAAAGLEVLIVERRQRVGEPVRCAEWVPQAILRHVSIASKSIRQTTDLLITHLPNGKSYEVTSPGFVLDRSFFDKEMVMAAAASGARISIETEATALTRRGIIVRHGTEQKEMDATVIVGADGGDSSMARSLGLPSMKKIVALQYETSNPYAQSEAEIFFDGDYMGGYGWFFPKGRTANLGLGVLPQHAHLLERLLEGLRERVEQKKHARLVILGRTGGSIPCGGPRRTVFGKILLAGDAAGHTHPITGAGILNALLTGRIAGRIAAEAVKKGSLSHLENYELEWRELLGGGLSYAASKRDWMEENWSRTDMDFEKLIRRTWTGFKEYHEGRRRNSLFKH